MAPDHRIDVVIAHEVASGSDAVALQNAYEAELEKRTRAGHYEVRISTSDDRILIVVKGPSQNDTIVERHQLVRETADATEIAAPMVLAVLRETDAPPPPPARRHDLLGMDPGLGVGLGFTAGSTFISRAALAGGALSLSADSHRWGVNLELRALRYVDRDDLFVALGIGGRFAFWDAETSPFIGAGLAYSFFGAGAAYTTFGGPTFEDGTGAGSYVEGGLSIFRSRATTWSAALRADQPWYSVPTRASDGTLVSTSWTMPVFVTVAVLLH